MIKKTFAYLTVLAAPSLAFAQQINVGNDLPSTVDNILAIILPIIFTLALAFFFWNLAQYFLGGEKGKEKAKDGLPWAFGILFIMLSLGGIVALLQNSVDFGNDTVEVPNFDNQVQ